MKSGRYGKGRKAVMIFLEILFTTLCAVCIGVVSCNAIISVPNRKNTLNLNYYISPFSRTAAFEDSDVFNDMVYDNLDDIIRYGVIRSQLETDGVFDKTKQIDIEQYARHFEEIPVTETSVCYRLGDLIQWGQSGDGISVEEYPYTEAERMIQDAHGRSEAVQKAEESEPVEVAEDGIHERYVLIPIERYRPSDGKSILAHVNSVDELETFEEDKDDTEDTESTDEESDEESEDESELFADSIEVSFDAVDFELEFTATIMTYGILGELDTEKLSEQV